MPEYYGYTSPQAPKVDFRDVFGEVGAKIVEALNVRDNERAAFATRADLSIQNINDYESSQNPTLESIVQEGANLGRDTIWEWRQAANSGKITQAKFKERMNTVDQYWSSFASAAKTFDQRSLETLKRQQPDENGDVLGSGFELYINKTHSEIANLGGRNVYINPDSGKIYLTKKDKEGNMVDFVDVRQINNPGNIIDNRVHLNKAVAENVKNWGDWKTYVEGAMGSSKTIEDIRQNPEFVNAKNSLARSILSNDRAIASVLVDNGSGDYRFYASKGELRGILGKEMEFARANAQQSGQEFNEQEFIQQQAKKMIFAEKDQTGVYQPILTEEQKAEAKRRVDEEIEIQLGMSQSGTQRWKPDYGGGRGADDDGSGDYSRYAVLERGWIDADTDLLNSVALPGYSFRVTYGNDNTPRVKVSKYTGMKDKRGNLIYDPILTANSARELSRFVFQPGSRRGVMVTPESQFDEQKRTKLGTVGSYKNERGILD